MPEIQWHASGARRFKTGVDHGVLYLPDAQGEYVTGFPWNGLTAVTEQPSGAESTKLYADNGVYLNMISAEQFAATIEAFTYPDEFAECDGSLELAPGVYVGQQARKPFGMSWRTLLGNELVGTDLGYELKLMYGGQAAPTEKANTTINESPEAQTMSWSVSTTPVEVPDARPTALLTIDSTQVPPAKLVLLEDILYGRGAATSPKLPTPTEVLELLAA